jgi:CRP-like cAMP-binding protein
MLDLLNYTVKNRLLAALPAEDRARFFSTLEPVELPLRKVVQEAGQAVKHVYFVESAVTSVLTVMSDGSMIEVGMIGSEGMVGVAAMLDPEATAVGQVIAQIPGSALKLPVALCRRAFDQSPAVRTVILRFASDLPHMSAQTAACNRLHSIEQRCARWLLMAYERVGSETMPMTHEFLASMLGVRRAGVTTTAGELQEAGLITYRQRSITIRDPEGLVALACECYAADHARYSRMR